MKLGLLYKITNEGERKIDAYCYNVNEDWCNENTGDIRKHIKMINGFDASGKSAYIIKLLGDKGYLIGVLNARHDIDEGRENDNTIGWVHFPAKISITGKETASILRCIETEICRSKGVEKENLDSIFLKEYEEKSGLLLSCTDHYKSNKNAGSSRIIFYEDDSELEHFLGDNIAQKEYEKYECIILIDKKHGFSSDTCDCSNFTPKVIHTIEAPEVKDGFSPFIKDRLFNKPVEMTDGETITVTWKKNGYKDIVKEAKVTNCSPNIDIKELDYEFLVRKNSFSVKSKNNKNVPQFEIVIDNKTITDESRTYLNEVRCVDGIDVLVKFGDNQEKLHIKIDPKYPKTEIRLEKFNLYTYNIEDKKGICRKFFLFSTEEKIENLPQIEKNKEEKIYTKDNLKDAALGLAAGFTVVFIGFALYKLIAFISPIVTKIFQ